MVFKVDMGALQTFDELVMATPSSPNDYARVFNVAVSADGSSWANVATCKGTSASQVVRFPAQTARYVRIALDQGTAAHYWWSIDELNVYTNGSVPPPSTTTTTTTTLPPRTTPTVSVSPSANPVQIGSIGAGQHGIEAVIVAFTYYANATQIMFEFNQIYRQLESSLTEAAQFTELLLTPPAVTDPVAPEPLRPAASDVRFEHVTFAHAGGSPLFTGLDLAVPGGTKLGLVGRSGGGRARWRACCCG